MRPYDAHERIVSYCRYSGAKPPDFEPSPPSKQRLADWYPYQKLTSIWDLSGTGWVPRPRCAKDCGWCVRGAHVSWCRHGQDSTQIAQCKDLGYPYVLNTQEMHRVPRSLCLEILEASMKQLAAPGMEALQDLIAHHKWSRNCYRTNTDLREENRMQDKGGRT